MQNFLNKIFKKDTSIQKTEIDKYEKIMIKIKDFSELSYNDLKFIKTLHKCHLIELLVLFNSNVNYMNEYILSLNS
jgi:hypothetical protein